jgi:hypothetical protein
MKEFVAWAIVEKAVYTLHEAKITKLGDGTSRIDFGPEIPV